MQTQTQQQKQVINLFTDKIHKEAVPVIIIPRHEMESRKNTKS